MPTEGNYHVGIPSVYAGPGDVVSSAFAWWGLRAYTLASIGSNALRLRASGDNVESDFTTIAGGGLDLAGISAFLVAHGGSLFVVNLYDQSGNGRDLGQLTAARQPTFTLGALGALPTMGFLRTSTLYLQTANITIAQPFSISSVFLESSAVSFTGIIGSDTTTTGLGHNTGQGAVSTSSEVSLSASFDSFFAMQGAFNGASSSMNRSGTSNTGSLSTEGWAGTQLHFGRVAGLAELTGQMTEGGIWPIAFSAGQMTSMNSNQRAYWGI